jgi:hypothetical protein
MEIFIATDTASVQPFFNMFTTGIETFVIPWDQLLNTCVVTNAGELPVYVAVIALMYLISCFWCR